MFNASNEIANDKCRDAWLVNEVLNATLSIDFTALTQRCQQERDLIVMGLLKLSLGQKHEILTGQTLIILGYIF